MADNDGLDQAMPCNGGGKILQTIFVKLVTRLILPRFDAGKRKRLYLLFLHGLKIGTEQRIESCTKASLFLYCHICFPLSLLKNSSARERYARLPLLFLS